MMDLEQLTLILETIQSMGGDAKEFGIWWMVCSILPKVISPVLLFCFGCLVLRFLVRIGGFFRDVDKDYIENQKQIRRELQEEETIKRHHESLEKENH